MEKNDHLNREYYAISKEYIEMKNTLSETITSVLDKRFESVIEKLDEATNENMIKTIEFKIKEVNNDLLIRYVELMLLKNNFTVVLAKRDNNYLLHVTN